ncbi:hypothetical protein HK096_007116 [Nowakowskiella sp. JEL0078]|nr:hypothetical protein HK096_007116 [Nowakowskiella sp. JEL0078]
MCLSKDIANLKERKMLRRAEYGRHLRTMEEMFEMEKTETESAMVERIHQIIGQAKSKIGGSIDQTTTLAYNNNKRLNKEISLHTEEFKKTQNEIESVLQSRQVLLTAQKSHGTDIRRRVLRLNAVMDCSPEMEFEISKKHLSMD